MSGYLTAMVWAHGPDDRGELLVLMALADNANDAGTCFPSAATIARKARMTDRGVRKVVDRLKADGWLTVAPRKRPGDGRQTSNMYQLSLSRLGARVAPEGAANAASNGAEPRSAPPEPRSGESRNGVPGRAPEPRSGHEHSEGKDTRARARRFPPSSPGRSGAQRSGALDGSQAQPRADRAAIGYALRTLERLPFEHPERAQIAAWLTGQGVAVPEAARDRRPGRAEKSDSGGGLRYGGR